MRGSKMSSVNTLVCVSLYNTVCQMYKKHCLLNLLQELATHNQLSHILIHPATV